MSAAPAEARPEEDDALGAAAAAEDGNDDDFVEEEEVEEEEDAFDDSEEEADFAPKKAKKRRKSVKVRGPKKRRNLSSFYDDQADEGDEEEEAHSRAAAELEDEFELERQKMVEEQDMRRAREVNVLQDRSAAEIAESVRRRHASKKRYSAVNPEQDEEIMEHSIVRQALLPTPTDSKLFMVGVRRGAERTVVMSLMSKAMVLTRQGKRVGIESATATGTPELIFVEGRSEPKVKEFLSGIHNVYVSKVRLVPLNQMTEVLNLSRRAKKPLQEGQWVRLKRGDYKGDLAKVVSVHEGGLRAVVMLIPRVDFSLAGLTAKEKKERLGGTRPPQRLFNASEAAKASSMHGLERRPMPHDPYGNMLDFFENNYYDPNGFLLKDVTVATQIREHDVNPQIEELLQFKNDTQGDLNDENADEKIAKLAASAMDAEEQTGAALFSRGDRVRVISGDLKNLMGTVVSVDPLSDLVYLKADNADIGDMQVQFQPDQLIKHIVPGSHVKVISGRYTGETGTVVQVDTLDGDWVCRLVSDLSFGRELAVSVRSVKVTPEVAQGLSRLQGYEVNDLVALGHNDSGIVIEVLREELVVLDQTESRRHVKPTELRGKLNAMSVRGGALDASNDPIKVGDMVSVEAGPHAKRSGTVLHIKRTILFLHDKHRTENRGIFVCKARQCRLSGVASRRAQQGAQLDVIVNARSSRRSRTQDLRGKSVKVKRGKLKGYLGIVVEETEKIVKVELHAKHKVVSLKKEDVRLVGDQNGAKDKDPMGPYDPAAAPDVMLGSQTPVTALGMGATPYGAASQTPMINAGATPLLDGSSTPSAQNTYWKVGASGDDDEWSDSSSFRGQTPLVGGDGRGGYGSSTPQSSTPQSEYSVDSSLASPAFPGIPPSPGYAGAPGYGGSNWLVGGALTRLATDGREGRVIAVDDREVTLLLNDGNKVHAARRDCERLRLSNGDKVRIIGGPHEGKNGTIARMEGTGEAWVTIAGHEQGVYKNVRVENLVKTG